MALTSSVQVVMKTPMRIEVIDSGLACADGSRKCLPPQDRKEVRMKKPSSIALHLFGLILALVSLINWITSPGFASSRRASSGPVSSAQLTPLSINAWSSNGPEGGSILSLAIDRSNPNVIYAGTIAGVFKSTDGGATWSAFNTGIASRRIAAIAIDPSNPNTIYAGTDVGVFKSTEGGATWSAINNGLPDRWYIWTLSIDPANSATLYIVTGSVIFKSINGGASWSNISDGLPIIRALAIDPVNTKVVYTSGYDDRAENRGVYKSTDGGASWSKSNEGLPRPFGIGYVLAIDPANTNTIYLLGSNAASRWEDTVFKSTDGGAHWSTISEDLISRNVQTIVVDPGNRNTIYAGTSNGGVFKSTNAGASWSASNTGLTNTGVSALAIDPGSANTVYAGTDPGGVFRSTDGGANWSVSNTGQKSINAYALAIAPSNADIMYGATSGGVFKSTNGGASWSKSDIGVTNTSVTALAIDPGDQDTIYAGAGESGAFKSTDGGGSWSAINNGLSLAYVGALVINPANPNTVYAATWAGVFRSTNGGASWSGISSLVTFGLLIDPSNTNTLYAASYDIYWDYPTILKSTDGGFIWRVSDSGLPYGAGVIGIDSIHPNTLYVGTYAGVYKSTDGGAMWKPASDGLITKSVQALAIDPDNSATVYAGTYGEGVFKSTDGGASWTPFNDGLSNLYINALAIDRSGTFLHAGTYGGVFDYQNPRPCSDSISPTIQSFDSSGGTGGVSVTASGECIWTATSATSWISITSSTGGGAGNGAINYSVAANPGTEPRTGNLIVAGRALIVTQAGLPVRINSASVQGKKLLVQGENFDPGAVILLNGEAQITTNDAQNPKTSLTGKKAGKKIRPGDKLQVLNPNGTLSQEFIFTGS